MGTVLSIIVLATIALLLGAVVAWRRGLQRQAMLMVVLAVVAAGNVAILTLPDASGEAPASKQIR